MRFRRSIKDSGGQSKTSAEQARHALGRTTEIGRVAVRFPPAPPRLKIASEQDFYRSHEGGGFPQAGREGL